MTSWTIIFLVLTFIAGVFAFFTGLAEAVVGVPQVLFVIFMILLLVSWLGRFPTGKSL
jgi:uncharacterized membrane protein YtjA (UPF0391 family)